MSRPRLYVVDGHNHIFRAFYAIRGMTRADGQATNAVYGFTSTLRKLIQDENPDLLAVTFDTAAGSFRNELYSEYKANRSAPPEDLIPQFSIIRDVVKAYNIASLELEGWEADDLMATLAVQAEQAGMDVTIVSTDKDLCQLVTEHVQLLNPMKNKRLGRDEVVEKMGVPPEQVTDLQGLCGDSSDNIPGVPGIGMKTAAKLIDSYQSIEGIYEAIDAGDKAIKGKRLENLVNFRDDAFLSRKLATLDLQVPIEETFGIGGDKGWESLKIGAPNVEQLRAIFEENQLRRFLSELPASEHQEADDAPAQSSEHQPLSAEHYTCVTTPRQLAEMCLELAASGGFAFDTETTGLDSRSDQLVGMSFAADRQRCWYVPMRHEHLGVDAQAGAQLELGALTGWRRDPQQLDPDEVLSALRPLLMDPDVPKAAQNAKFDLKMLQAAGIAVEGLDFDPMLASYLLDAHQRKHGLDALAERWLGHEALSFGDLQDLSGVKGTKKTPLQFGRVDLALATTYACEDAQMVWALREQMEPQLDDSELRELMDGMELPLSHVLSDMEQTGIRVDVDKLQALSDELGQRAETLVSEATKLVGRPFNLGSPKQLQQILFEELGLKSRKRTKTGFSTDSSVLELLTDAHPLPELILRWRQATKLKNTYTDVLPTLVHPKTERIHTSFHQAVAATGRLSSSNPNLQNIPVRSDDGARIRDAFVAAPGHVLLAADYSQIELRVLAHLCEDPAMSQAFSEGADVHARTASLLFDTAESEVSREQRAMAKTVNFGVLYGMSASRLAREQSISNAEAKAFIERYFNRFPRIEQWKVEAMEQAREQGASKTLLGRVRKLPELHSKSRMARAAAERIAINTPIQGSAADIIKRAMIVLHGRLATQMPEVKLLLQVHDELVLEVPEQMIAEASELAVSVMENAFDLRVPLVVNANHGQTWLQAH